MNRLLPYLGNVCPHCRADRRQKLLIAATATIETAADNLVELWVPSLHDLTENDPQFVTCRLNCRLPDAPINDMARHVVDVLRETAARLLSAADDVEACRQKGVL